MIMIWKCVTGMKDVNKRAYNICKQQIKRPHSKIVKKKTQKVLNNITHLQLLTGKANYQKKLCVRGIKIKLKSRMMKSFEVLGDGEPRV